MALPLSANSDAVEVVPLLIKKEDRVNSKNRHDSVRGLVRGLAMATTTTPGEGL
jgi:hypothetical protein